MAVSVLNRLLDKDFPVDRVLVSHDCEASLRLFYAVRELRRIDPSLGLPEPYLVDVLHLPYRTTTAYTVTRVHELRERIADWYGPVTDDALTTAIGLHDEQRRLLREVAAWRRSDPPRLRGTEALAIFAAAMRLPVGEHIERLRALLADPPEPVPDGQRVFLTGSAHDTPHVYVTLEEHGYLVVGEDHDWGDLWCAVPVHGRGVRALAERYQFRGPVASRSSMAVRAAYTTAAARACGAERVISYARRLDQAPAWDFPAQRAALADAGIPAILLKHQEYGKVMLPDDARGQATGVGG
jgi:benzoyl-CoA reductase/2-hydroxyglutaryl-CoA dehydratase subunit BcrC/BadD/HgdB